MRNTKQKELILNIINSSKKHYTVNDIYNECVKVIPNISLGTVYRNLNYLVDKQKIKRIKMANNIDRYDNVIKHSHVICKKCGKIDDVFYDFNIELPDINNYDVIDYDLSFNGICKNCKKKEN